MQGRRSRGWLYRRDLDALVGQPDQRPGRLDRNLAAHQDLLARLREHGWHALTDAACHHPDLAWTEQVVIIVGAEENCVLRLARQFHQSAVLR
ncbi:hypothetical protein Pth03_45000 [Planotetraspora thailandica]|uniref:Uncharacterized protein n=1 Tax=Planotetraspora thailandica TaxID=487172 RepID=A0A8J3V3H7_9ACTN|nr:DUF3293 domain-containing protein [Planotetraspora thailandica]GII56111.1 hypothetical protein Pth03_45000 [Planotetraspora thailandica]